MNKVKKYGMKLMVGGSPGHRRIVEGTENMKVNLPAPRLTAVYTGIPPTVDGKLDDSLLKEVFYRPLIPGAISSVHSHPIKI